MNETKILTQVVALGDQMETISDEIMKIETLLNLNRMRVGMIEMLTNSRLEAMNLRLESLEKQNVTS
ncbi:MAG: hypothetical protein WCR46_07190 [Deltaproteobacteria bacterium]